MQYNPCNHAISHPTTQVHQGGGGDKNDTPPHPTQPRANTRERAEAITWQKWSGVQCASDGVVHADVLTLENVPSCVVGGRPVHTVDGRHVVEKADPTMRGVCYGCDAHERALPEMVHDHARAWCICMRQPFNGYVNSNTMRDMIKGSNKDDISQEYWRDCYHRGHVSLGLDGGIQVGFQGFVLESPGSPPIIGQQTRTW
jgi:hypothetical protein